MVERGHCHTKANCAVARKLVARTWATITSGTPYQLRDLDGTPVTRRQATTSQDANRSPRTLTTTPASHRPVANVHDRARPRDGHAIVTPCFRGLVALVRAGAW